MLESLPDPVLVGVWLGVTPVDSEEVGVGDCVGDTLASMLVDDVLLPVDVAVPVGDSDSLDDVLGVIDGVISFEPVNETLAPILRVGVGVELDVLDNDKVEDGV